MKQHFHILLIIIVTSFVFIAFTQFYNENYPRWQKIKLYKENKVWMVYGWRFQYIKGVQEKKGKKVSFERFDRNGNRIEEIYYDTKGNLYYSCQFFYDDNGNEIKKMGSSGDEIIYDKWIYTPIDNGKKIERKSAYRKGKDQKWIYMLDANGNRLEETYYDVNGNISYKWQFVYDANQRLTEKIEFDAYGNIYQKWFYKYDNKGNNTEIYHYVSNNELYRIYQMRYDKKGNMKSKFILDKDEHVLELIIYIYQFYEGLHAPRTLGNKQ
jgi:hypothetical protein